MPVAIPIAMVIGTGVAAWSANKQAEASRDAANTINQGSRDAANIQRKMYENTQNDLSPYAQTGKQALGNLSSMAAQPFNFKFDSNDPAYQFRLNQGLDAVNASAAARGGYFSGGTGKALVYYGQGLASTEYGNSFNRALAVRQNNFGELQNLASIGQNAAAQTGSAGMQYGVNAGNNIMTGAQALGAGQVGQANAWANGAQNINNQVQSGVGSYLQYQMMNNALNGNNYENQNQKIINNQQVINDMNAPRLAYNRRY